MSKFFFIFLYSCIVFLTGFRLYAAEGCVPTFTGGVIKLQAVGISGVSDCYFYVDTEGRRGVFPEKPSTSTVVSKAAFSILGKALFLGNTVYVNTAGAKTEVKIFALGYKP